MSTAGEKRIPELEGIRGILSLLVVSGHVYPDPIFWFPGCMEVFFVISGYLITRILLNAPQVDGRFLKVYFIRRALRIWPMYYISLSLYALFSGWLLLYLDFHWHDKDYTWLPSWEPMIRSIFFLQFTEAPLSAELSKYPGLFQHSWSVALEEQFYVLWPFLFLALSRSRASLTWLVGLAAIGGATLFRCFSYFEYDAAVSMWLLPSRLDSLALGALLAFLLRKAQGDPTSRSAGPVLRGAVFAGLLILTPYLLDGYGWKTSGVPAELLWTVFHPTLGFAVLAFGLVGLAVLNTGSNSLTWLRSRSLMHLGAISYSTYLLHIFAIVLATMFLQQREIANEGLRLALSLALAISLAHLTYRYVEMKALTLKKGLPYARAETKKAGPR